MYNLSMKDESIQGFKELGKIGVASILTEWQPMTQVFAHAFSKTLDADFIFVQSNGTVVINTANNNTVVNKRALFNTDVVEVVENLIEKILITKIPTVLYFDQMDLFPESVDKMISDFMRSENRSCVWTFVVGNEQQSAKRLFNQKEQVSERFIMA